jgi:hypothetical protein
MEVREHRDKLTTAIDVQKLIDVVPLLDRFRALERVHEDRTTPTMGIVFSTIVDFMSLIREAGRTLPVEIRHYAVALNTAALHYFPRKSRAQYVPLITPALLGFVDIDQPSQAVVAGFLCGTLPNSTSLRLCVN